MVLAIEIPAGAPADMEELEYCSALRQTDTSHLRINGSLTPEDIRLHLISRHGVRVDVYKIESSIMVELGGSIEYDDDDKEEAGSLESVPDVLNGGSAVDVSAFPLIKATTNLDLVQQTALLLIPELLECAAVAREQAAGSRRRSKRPSYYHLVDEAPSMSKVSPTAHAAAQVVEELQAAKMQSDEPDESFSLPSYMQSVERDAESIAATSYAMSTLASIAPPDRREPREDAVPETSENGSAEDASAQIASLNDQKATDDDEESLPSSIFDDTEKVLNDEASAESGATSDASTPPPPPESTTGQVAVAPPSPTILASRSRQDPTTPKAHNLVKAKDGVSMPSMEDTSVYKESTLGDAGRYRKTSAAVTKKEKTRQASREAVKPMDDDNWSEEDELEDEGKDDRLDPSVISAVLLMILEETGLEYGVDLTVEVLRRILVTFGEDHWPDALLEDMLSLAAGGTLDGGTDDNVSSIVSTMPELPILDDETFLQALTTDVEIYDTDCRKRATTYFRDANKMNARRSNRPASQLQQMRACGGERPPKLERMYTAPSIDYTADTYASFTWSILAWFSLIAAFFSYLFTSLGQGLPQVDCASNPTFGCIVGASIVLWLEVFVVLCVLGFSYIFLCTLGNSVYLYQRPRWLRAITVLVSIGVVCVTTILSYTFEVRTRFFSTEKQEGLDPLYILTVGLGVIILFLQISQLGRMLVSTRCLHGFLEVVSPSAMKLERRTKQAAHFKVNRMVDRALSCHVAKDGHVLDSTSQHSEMRVNHDRLAIFHVHGRVATALYRFHAESSEREAIGGVWWTVYNYAFRRKLTREEGLWLFPRLIWTNMGMWLVFVAVIYAWIYVSALIRTNSNSFPDGLTLQGTLAAISIGALAALAGTAAAAVLYIPSTVTTLFRLRGGMIGTLRNSQFRPHRFAQDQSTILFGSAFWGTAFTGIVCWIFISGLAFLLAFEATRPVFVLILAQVIGLLTTIALKVLMLQLLRFRFYGAFYRRFPMAANVMHVILECWNLGLSSGYILARTLKLIFLAVFYIGRIDTPFLADGVGWFFGKVPLDSYTIAFRKDLMIHEAHRHPYMERWAQLYLLKLRHGPSFGSQAGAAWRILFTLALMPWLRKYRVYPHNKKVDYVRSEHSDAVYYQRQVLATEVEALRGERKRRQELEVEVEKLRRLVIRLREKSVIAI